MVAPIWLIQVFWLPETLRSLVGNGSGYANPTPLQFWRKYRSEKSQTKNASDEEKKMGEIIQSDDNMQSNTTLYQAQSQLDVSEAQSTTSSEETKNDTKRNGCIAFPNPFQSFTVLKEKDVAILLFYNACQYSGIYCIITSMTGLLVDNYGLNSFQVGMCFLPNGIAGVIGSYLSGKVLDWQFKKTSKALGTYEKYMQG